MTRLTAEASESNPPASEFEHPTSRMQSPTFDSQPADLCYQCAKCSSGCPIAQAMDYMPHQVLKLLQLGLTQDVLASSTIWLCAGCLTCAARCPMGIDLPHVMHELCEQAIASSVPAAERRLAAFHATFLADVQRRGRVHELRQLLGYKLEARDFLSDIPLGAKMLTKGRLALKSNGVHKLGQVQDLFSRFPVRSRAPKDG